MTATTEQKIAHRKANLLKIADAIGEASNDINAWDQSSLEDVARQVATDSRREWVNEIARQADDSDEAEAMIAAADKVLAEIDRTVADDPRE